MPFDALEYVVRPYTTPNAHGAVIIPSTPRGSRQKATLTWGKPITMPAVEDSGYNFEVVCCKDDLSEKSRETENVRVYQDGDQNSSTYIDYERPTTMKLNKKEKNTCGDNWDDISGVAQQVDETFAEWDAIMNSGTTASPDKNCGTAWKFKNKT